MERIMITLKFYLTHNKEGMSFTSKERRNWNKKLKIKRKVEQFCLNIARIDLKLMRSLKRLWLKRVREEMLLMSFTKMLKEELRNQMIEV
jgi:hypothetical protein